MYVCILLYIQVTIQFSAVASLLRGDKVDLFSPGWVLKVTRLGNVVSRRTLAIQSVKTIRIPILKDHIL